VIGKHSFAPREGVGASSIVLPPGSWSTVLDFLVERFPDVGRAEIARRSRAGDVLDAAGQPLDPHLAYSPGARLFYFRHVENEAPIPFEETILHADENLVVADKPHFLPMSPIGRYARETLLARLKRRTGLSTLAPMHRLDRETAGVVAFTVQPSMRGAYQRLFAAGDVEKHYEAIAPWRDDLEFPLIARHRLAADSHFMRMRVIEGEPNAQTRIDLIERLGTYARYALTPSSGKKHQLRVQMAALGMPIVNDAMYPLMRARESVEDFSRPLKLLATRLAFTDPISGARREFNTQRTLQDDAPVSR
jgi:tRNA pseudouridine32 synthase / 23S rRNA pseudouridine746 synthase